MYTPTLACLRKYVEMLIRTHDGCLRQIYVYICARTYRASALVRCTCRMCAIGANTKSRRRPARQKRNCNNAYRYTDNACLLMKYRRYTRYQCIVMNRKSSRLCIISLFVCLHTHIYIYLYAYRCIYTCSFYTHFHFYIMSRPGKGQRVSNWMN